MSGSFFEFMYIFENAWFYKFPNTNFKLLLYNFLDEKNPRYKQPRKISLKIRENSELGIRKRM